MKTKTILLLLPALLLLTSCGVYRTQMVDIPLMGEQGELQLSGSVSSLLHHPAVSATATYAVTDHLAVQGYFLSSQLANTHAVQGAVGYYTPVKNSRAIFELYAGVNACWTDFTTITNSDESHYTSWADNGDNVELERNTVARSQNYFLQANYGWCVSDRFEWGFALKGGLLHINRDEYTDIITDSYIENGHEYVLDVRTQENKNLVDYRRLIEPQLFFRWGRNHLKYHFQMGLSFMDQTPTYLDIDPISLGFGLSYRF